MRPAIAALLALVVAFALVPYSAVAVPGKSVGQQVRLQLLAINDFHGQIVPYGSSFGSIANLAGHMNVRQAEAKRSNTDTWRLGVGDLVGASPAASALLQDEPTLEALDQMGFKYSSVGNHEFDEGLEELHRLQYGGYSDITGDWAGTDMQYLAANVVYEGTDKTIFPAYAVSRVRGVKVGIIGVVTAETPTIVTASGVAGLEFIDPAEAVNKAVGKLKKRGIEAIIVLAHEGGYGDTAGGPITGNIVPVVEAMDDEVDVVLSAHSHQRYWGYIDGKLVTQAHNAGRAFADIDLVIDRRSGEVVSKKAEIVVAGLSDAIMPDPAVQAIVDEAVALTAPITNQVVATAAADITRTQNAAGESALGNLIADGQRWDMGTQIAFMNPGGIRAELMAGEVTYGELFAIQPFSNYMVTMKLTGAQIEAILEQQWQPTATRMLQISGISYSWSESGPAGAKIDPAGIMVGGVTLDLAATYTVTSNNFLAEGGDGFTTFASATDKVYWGSDLDTFIKYVTQLAQPFNAMIDGRINVLP
jgi:5'-nucleotidase